MAVMRDTDKTDEWIKERSARNPITEILIDGKPSGRFRGGPLRMSYPQLLRPVLNRADRNNPDKKPACAVALLFTPFSDLRPIYIASVRIIAEHWRQSPNELAKNFPTGVPTQIAGMNTPFTDQGKRDDNGQIKSGFTPGLMFLNARSPEPVPVFRFSGGKEVPVTDEKAIYGGQWCLPVWSLYISKAIPEKQIPSRLCASIEKVMLYADDRSLGRRQTVDNTVAFGGAEGIEEVGLPDAPASQGGFPGGLEEYGVPVQPDFSKMFGG